MMNNDEIRDPLYISGGRLDLPWLYLMLLL